MKLFENMIINKVRNKFLLLSFLFLTATVLCHGQILRSVNVVLQPPYSSKYSTYENLANHAIITLIGGPLPMNIVLYGSLSKTGSDFLIETRKGYQGGKFNLPANMTKVIINDVPSMLFLNRYNVVHNGISEDEWMEILKNDQLPEGQYRFCVQAYMDSSFLGLQPVGPQACFDFSISLANPPVIISPSNGQVLNPQAPNTVFSWTPPIGNTIGAEVVYDLYIVKVPQGQNPNDVMNAAVNYRANNPIIKTNLTGNQYVTQPYDLPLDSNTLYAVQVVARDALKKVSFENNGRSEVVTFTKGKSQMPIIVSSGVNIPASNNPTQGYTVKNVDPVPYSQLKGKLYYRFKDDISQLKSLQSQSSKTKNSKVLKFVSEDDLVYNKDNTPIGDARPLADKKVSLIITYVFSGNLGGQNVSDRPIPNDGKSIPSDAMPDADEVLATTTTGSDGSFTFNFVNVEKKLGLLQDNYSYSKEVSEGENYNVQGKLFKVLRIRVEDKYYCSPDVDMKVDPWKGIDLGTLISFVKSYTLKVRVITTNSKFWDMAQGQGSPLSGISTMVLRKTVVPSVPQDEGETFNSKKTTDGALAEQESDKDGYVIFQHLVQHDPDNQNDCYYIKCVPDKNNGNFIFKETEQSYYPIYDKDRLNFPFNAVRTYTPSSGGPSFGIPYGENITWNHELVIKTYTDSISLFPSNPRIAGKVQDAANVGAKAMSGVKVVMINGYKNSSDGSLFTIVKTNNQGRYEFNNLPVELGAFKVGEVSSVIGPTRTLVTKPDGYKGGALPGGNNSYAPLKWGQQLINQDFNLTPDGFLSGYVEDENGDPVEADINVDGYDETTTTPQFLYNKNQGVSHKPSGKIAIKIPTGMRQVFSLPAPSGQRKITITPSDKAYAVSDTELVIPKRDTKSSEIKFVVLRMQKRIRFRVAEYPTGINISHLFQQAGNTAKAISGADVTLNIPKPLTQTSDKDGYVTFIFDNMASSFDFTITPPTNADFEEGDYNIMNVENTIQTKTYGDAYLKKAAVISGKVTLGTGNKPLPGARISIDMGGGKQLEALTDSNGDYTLRGVPSLPVEKNVWAGQPGAIPNVISQSKKITVTVGKENKLDFNLINDNELIIENIFGFEVDIQQRTKQNDGTWLVSGSIINLKGNDNFSLQNQNKKQSIPFHNLKIKKSGIIKNGIPVGIPADNSFFTDLASLQLLMQNSFGVIQLPSSGDQLEIKAVSQNGMITGKIAIQKSSFQFTQNYAIFNNDPDKAMLLTDKPGSFDTELPSIAVSAGAKKKYGLCNLQGTNLSFKLLGFDASAEVVGSWIQDNSISLQTVIHINALPGMSPSSLDINAGNLVIHPDGLEPLKGNTPLTFNLEKWQFVGNSWQLSENSSSIAIASGTMKTGSIDIPLSDISLGPDHISIGSYDVNDLSMAGIIPVDVVTKNPVFGYNKSIGKDEGPHYEFRLIGEAGQPGVIINSLPGMKQGDAMKFQTVSLVSDGEQIFDPGTQNNNLTFYSIMNVMPIEFESGSNYVNMSCGIDLGIPQLEETNGMIQFSKESGKITFMLYPLNVSLNGPGGVEFSADVEFNDHPQNLSEGKFTALGTIYDNEGIKLKGILTKTANAIGIKVDPENQALPLGGNNTSLADIKGNMDADMGSQTWKNFTFSGAMKGFTGMQGDTRKTFTITGSIDANNQKIEVKNIPTGFGNIGLTYDIPNSRFIGNLQLNKQIGPMSIAGTAMLLVDPGGWYFLAGGKLETPGFGEISAGLLIGNYNSMPSNVSTALMQYAYDKTLPPGFQNGISGFFFTGLKDLPILNIPDFSINLGVLNATFGAQAGADGRLWMDFSKTGNEYGIGVMLFADAYLKGEAITCTKFYAEARAELGMKGIYDTSNGYFSLNGCGSFTISGGIQQCVPTPCLSGICCTPCAGINASAGIKINFLLDSNGNTGLSFGFGNCSGQPTMTGDW